MTVGIVRATWDDLEQSMAELLRLIGYRPQREALFIKPNVPDSGPPGQGLYTDPAVVEAFLKLFPGMPTVIGEGGIVGRDAGIALQKNGYAAVAERCDATLVNLEHAERYTVSWPYGQLKLPIYLLTHEYINIAKMKTHVQTGVTLGMKNQKGLLTSTDKRRFHRLGLNECIRALADVVRPALTIVDGIVALEGNGPWRYGRPREMNVLVAGTDLIEVDNVCRQLMGFPPEHAPHIPPLPSVETVGLSIEEAQRPFAFDYQGYFVYKNVYEHIHDSCSGCNWVLYYAFKAVKSNHWRQLKFLYRGVWRRLDIVMGHASQLPAGHGKVICMGDCARQFAEEHGLPLARGCPPKVEDVLRLL
ncbi:MAG: DUF362 domain-containing protein [Chloroflexi bacterium]|nr:DUF362 domain-containing protein [Chloroflexota bacterium]